MPREHLSRKIAQVAVERTRAEIQLFRVHVILQLTFQNRRVLMGFIVLLLRPYSGPSDMQTQTLDGALVQDGPKDVCKKVSQRQYRNHKDVIVSED